MSDIFLRLPAVKDRAGLSRSTIYLGIATGTFPQPIKLGVRAVGWLESDIDAWIAARVEQRGGSDKQACRSAPERLTSESMRSS
jgi:prophage regulatory protein